MSFWNYFIYGELFTYFILVKISLLMCPTHREIFSKSYWIKQESDCIYYFSIDWNQTDISLVLNKLENGKYNLISVRFNKISEKKIRCAKAAWGSHVRLNDNIWTHGALWLACTRGRYSLFYTCWRPIMGI